jgi:hypothetical protein
MIRRLPWLGLVLTLALTPALTSLAAAPDVGRSYEVPYRLTDTNHFLVRVRLNGKGPFNFLVDTGAPALYVSTDTAKKVGLKTSDEEFWTPVERLDFEGGAFLRDVKARVEDPFQLVGMNALGLPGASIDGILGFTMLARYRIELDPTNDRMTWTRLDFEPKEPPVPPREPGQKGRASSGMQAMNALGPLAKLAAALIGRQPEEERLPRGFFGVEVEPTGGDVVRVAPGVVVTRVLPGSPAAEAGVRPGDILTEIGDRTVRDLTAARAAVAEVRPGDRVALTVVRLRRDPERPTRVEGKTTLALTVTAGEGF